MSADWTDSTLGEYLDFKNGKTPPDRVDTASLPVYGSNGVIGFSDEANAPENCLIIGRVGSYCGSVYHSKTKCWVTDNAILGLTKVPSESEFWYFLLLALQLNSFRSGSGQPLLNQTTLKSVPIRVPKQSMIRVDIGKKLMKFNEKMALNTQTNQTLEAIAQAIFKSWFVDFEPVKAKMAVLEAGGTAEEAERAAMCAISGKDEAALTQLQTEQSDAYAELAQTAALFPSVMQDSELGEIPEGWDVASLSDLIQITGGGTPKRSEPNYWNGDIPWFSVKDVPADGNVFVVDTEEKITHEGLKKSSTKLLKKGTTIITARGTVGKLALLASDMCMNQSCYGINGKDTGPYFNYFNLFQAVSTLQRNTHGAVFDTITTKTFDTYRTSLSGSEIANRFDAVVMSMLEKIESNIRENMVLTRIRDTLLPKLLSGEIDLSQAADMADEVSV